MYISYLATNTITFTGNYAKDATAGHTIYATSLHPCQAIYNLTTSGYTLVDTTEVFNVRDIKFVKGSRIDNEPPIATDGAVLHSMMSMPLAIIPGERYKHNVMVTDDLDQTINASFGQSSSQDKMENQLT